MLKDQVQSYLSDLLQGQQGNVEMYKEEKDYVEKKQLAASNSDVTLVEANPEGRFEDAYIERGDKESEETIAIESSDFLNQPVRYLKDHQNEFLYVESKWFDIIGVDAVSFEVDDVFGTYDVMLGLKMQKKYGNTLKELLNSHLLGDEAKFDLIFSQNDGLWDLNFTLNLVEGFNEELTIGEAYRVIYRFLFTLVEGVEENK